MEQLEQSVSSLVSNQKQIMEQLTEICAKLGSLSSSREKGESSQNRNGKRPEGRVAIEGGHSGGSNHSYAPRLVILAEVIIHMPLVW